LDINKENVMKKSIIHFLLACAFCSTAAAGTDCRYFDAQLSDHARHAISGDHALHHKPQR